MSIKNLGAALGVVLTAAAFHASAGLSAMDEPSPSKADCASPVNTDAPACAPQNGVASDDQIYESADRNAKNGDYQGALAAAAKARNQDDPRILRVIGFATRKLGDVDAALPFYEKALSLDPDDTKTRQDMGEAYLSMGDMPSAREQLRQIEKRCGVSCDDYQSLADAIAATHAKLHTMGLL